MPCLQLQAVNKEVEPLPFHNYDEEEELQLLGYIRNNNK